MYPCPKCGGSGNIPMFARIEHGICFMCDGSGEVKNLPKSNIVDESCFGIYRMRLDHDSKYYIATFYIWNDDATKYANTGHYHIDLIDPDVTTDDDNWCVGEYKSTDILTIEDNDYHLPINQVRAYYRTLQAQEYKHVEYSPSLYQRDADEDLDYNHDSSLDNISKEGINEIIHGE